MLSDMPLLSVGNVSGSVSSGVMGLGHGLSIPIDHDYSTESRENGEDNDEENEDGEADDSPRRSRSAVVSSAR